MVTKFNSAILTRCFGMEIIMINFDEEIKKFHPSLEIDEAEDAIYHNNASDLTDIILEMMKENEEKNLR